MNADVFTATIICFLPKAGPEEKRRAVDKFWTWQGKKVGHEPGKTLTANLVDEKNTDRIVIDLVTTWDQSRTWTLRSESERLAQSLAQLFDCSLVELSWVCPGGKGQISITRPR